MLNPYHQVDMQTGEKTVWRMFLDRYETLYTLENVVQNWKNFDRCFAFHGICYNREFYQKHRYELPEKSSMRTTNTLRSHAPMQQAFTPWICICTSIWWATQSRAYR